MARRSPGDNMNIAQQFALQFIRRHHRITSSPPPSSLRPSLPSVSLSLYRPDTARPTNWLLRSPRQLTLPYSPSFRRLTNFQGRRHDAPTTTITTATTTTTTHHHYNHRHHHSYATTTATTTAAAATATTTTNTTTTGSIGTPRLFQYSSCACGLFTHRPGISWA